MTLTELRAVGTVGNEKMLDPGSSTFNTEVSLELFKLQTRQAARELFEQSRIPINTEGAGVLAYGELPPDPPELIPGLLLSSGANEICAQKETGKSLMALEIQSSLLTGQPLWGAIEPTARIKKSVHMLGEHSAPTLQGLYHASKLPHEGNLVIVGPEHLGSLKTLVVKGVAQRAAIEYHKRLVDGAGLVVYDPLAAFIQGENAENDNTAMRILVDSMIEISTSTGAALLILAHQGKPKIGVDGQEHRRSSYATRGASSQEDAMVSVHYLTNTKTVDQQTGPEVIELRTRWFKGRKNETPVTRLARKDLRHTVLAGSRPTKEVRKLEFLTNLAAYEQAHPNEHKETGVVAVSQAMGISDRTGWRYVENRD